MECRSTRIRRSRGGGEKEEEEEEETKKRKRRRRRRRERDEEEEEEEEKEKKTIYSDFLPPLHTIRLIHMLPFRVFNSLCANVLAVSEVFFSFLFFFLPPLLNMLHRLSGTFSLTKRLSDILELSSFEMKKKKKKKSGLFKLPC